MDQATFTEIRRVVYQILHDTGSTRLDPSFCDHCRSLREEAHLKRYVRHKLDLFELGSVDIRDKVILDAGCGFGITCIVLAMLGAKEVHGVDIYRPWLRTFEAYLIQLKLDLPIYPRLGDVSELDYPSEFFDIVLSNEAISHYRRVPEFLLEASRVLKKGGTLLVADGNNMSNPFRAAQMREIWRRFEEGPPGEVHGHKVHMPYAVMRRKIIQEQFPELNEREVAGLSAGTFGMNRAEITELCQEYISKGTLPQRSRTEDECPLDPLADSVIERAFRPRQLVDHMSSYGLKAKPYGYFGGAHSDWSSICQRKLLPHGRYGSTIIALVLMDSGTEKLSFLGSLERMDGKSRTH